MNFVLPYLFLMDDLRNLEASRGSTSPSYLPLTLLHIHLPNTLPAVVSDVHTGFFFSFYLFVEFMRWNFGASGVVCSGLSFFPLFFLFFLVYGMSPWPCFLHYAAIFVEIGFIVPLRRCFLDQLHDRSFFVLNYLSVSRINL
jgi:hypothetical protein